MAEDARTRRLRTDLAKVGALLDKAGGKVEIVATKGDPPHEYDVRFHLKGIEQIVEGEPAYREIHEITLKIPSGYPLQPPYVRMKTPVFHPHVFDNGQVCLGARWQVGEGLDNLLMRIAAILRYDPAYFDFESAANHEAADWARSHAPLFPLEGDPFGAEVAPEAVIRRIGWQED